MDIHTLIRSEKDSISIPELRKMLGIGKTESYWLIQRRGIKTFQLKGCMRIRNEDFWNWYDGQTRHQLLQGPPPGRALKETSYSVRELTELLAVSRDTIYTLLKKNIFETFQADNHTRITKDSFEAWYQSQSHYQKVVAVQEPMPLEEEPAADESTMGLSDPENETAADLARPKSVYRVCDLQRALGINRKAVYRMIQAGEIKAMLVGKEYLICPAEFEKVTGGEKDGDHYSQE